jgi:hypothetical protein
MLKTHINFLKNFRFLFIWFSMTKFSIFNMTRPQVPCWTPNYVKGGSKWDLVPLLASNTKRGWEGRAKSSGIRLGRGSSYLVIRSCIQKPTTSRLELILHPFDVGRSHERPWTHLTHHGLDSWEATTFPHIIFSTAPRGGYIWMTLFPRTPKEESQNCLGLDSRDFGHP